MCWIHSLRSQRGDSAVREEVLLPCLHDSVEDSHVRGVNLHGETTLLAQPMKVSCHA